MPTLRHRQLSQPLPRKGTETKAKLLLYQLLLEEDQSFATITPQGDGNALTVPFSLSGRTSFATITPQGDGNALTVPFSLSGRTSFATITPQGDGNYFDSAYAKSDIKLSRNGSSPGDTLERADRLKSHRYPNCDRLRCIKDDRF